MKRNRHLPVTDHAVLRWIERMGFVNVEAIRSAIHEETREALNSGATRVRINGADYRIANGIVTTVIFARDKVRRLRWGTK